MIDPTAMSRFTALREAAGKIDRLVPHVRLMEQPPHESRDTASVALEFPTPLVVLNSTIRQALSFLFSACDTVQTDKTERGICFTFTVSKMWIKEDSQSTAPSLFPSTRPSHRRLLTTGEPCMNKMDESCVWIRRAHPFFTHFLRLKQLAAT